MYINHKSRKIGLFTCSSGFEFYEIQELVILLKKHLCFYPVMQINDTHKGNADTVLSRPDVAPPMSDVQDESHKVNHEINRFVGLHNYLKIPKRIFKNRETISSCRKFAPLYDHGLISSTHWEKVVNQLHGFAKKNLIFHSANNDDILGVYYYKQVDTFNASTLIDHVGAAKGTTLNTPFYKTRKVGPCFEADATANIRWQKPTEQNCPSVTEKPLNFQKFKHATVLTGCIYKSRLTGLIESRSSPFILN